MLHLIDAQKCAVHYKNELVDKYYVITTLNNNSLTLKSNGKQFPHLIGIQKWQYQKSKMSGEDVYLELLKDKPNLSKNILKQDINENSKSGRKIKHFNKFEESLFKSPKTICILYNESLSDTKLANIDYLFSNYNDGFSSGWLFDSKENCCIPISWIDESRGTIEDKEKYYLKQSFDLIKRIDVYDSLTNSLINSYICKRNIIDYIKLIKLMRKNQMKLIKIHPNFIIRILSVFKI